MTRKKNKTKNNKAHNEKPNIEEANIVLPIPNNLLPFQCPICKQCLKSKQGFDYHIDNTDCINKKKNEKYKCPICPGDEYLCDKRSFNSHLEKKHKDYYISITNNNQIINNNANDINNNNNTGDVTINKTNNKTINNKVINNDNKIIINNTINNISISYPPDINNYSTHLLMTLLGADNLLTKFIEETNTNKDKPQYHNIICPYKVGEVYQNNKWTKHTIKNIANLIIEHITEYINFWLNVAKSGKNKHDIKLLQDFLDKLKNMKKRKSMQLDISNVLSQNTTLLKESREKYHPNNPYHPHEPSDSPKKKNKSKKHKSKKTSSKSTSEDSDVFDDSDSYSGHDSLDDISFDTDDTFYRRKPPQ